MGSLVCIAKTIRYHHTRPWKHWDVNCAASSAQNLGANLMGCLKSHLNVFWDEGSVKCCSGLCLTDILMCRGAGGDHG